MATLLTLHVVDGHLGVDEKHRPILYCPTQLSCKYASSDLSDALYALWSPLETVSAVMEETVIRYLDVHGEKLDVHGDEFVPVPCRGNGWSLLLVTTEQLLTVDWDNLSEDPHGKICKGAAWAYVAKLPPETQIVICLSH